MEAVGLISSPKYAEKQVGYMVTSVLLNEVRVHRGAGAFALPSTLRRVSHALHLSTTSFCGSSSTPYATTSRAAMTPSKRSGLCSYPTVRLTAGAWTRLLGTSALAADRPCRACCAQLAARSLRSRWQPTCSACLSLALCGPSCARKRRCACFAFSGATRMCSTKRSGAEQRPAWQSSAAVCTELVSLAQG